MSSEFHARIHTLLQTMEHRDVARLKSPTVTGKIMNEADSRKESPRVKGWVASLPLSAVFIYFSPFSTLLPNGRYIILSINGSLTATTVVTASFRETEWKLGDDAREAR